jgi:hypothetical protein
MRVTALSRSVHREAEVDSVVLAAVLPDPWDIRQAAAPAELEAAQGLKNMRVPMGRSVGAARNRSLGAPIELDESAPSHDCETARPAPAAP